MTGRLASVGRGDGLGDCALPLARSYDAGLFDLDGVLYLGNSPVAHAAASVAAARVEGMRVAFVTNNASRRPDVVARQLAELGIPADPADVVTSAQAAARWLAARLPQGAHVLVVGTDGLADEITDVGLVAVRSADEEPVAVAQGLSRTTGWAELAEAGLALRRDIPWVAGNADATLPSTRGPLPGNGAFVAALVAMTGRTPVVVGKPEPQLHLESVSRVGARRPLVVGDRLDTDILGAARGGADSLLVLTGVVDREQLLAAPRGSRPTYVAADLRALLRPQLDVHVDAGVARCGDVRARWRADTVELSGAGGTVDPHCDDALRAACALAWARADAAA